MLVNWCETLGVAPAARISDLAGKLAGAMDDPDWRALIHDDLANARQCIERDGSLWLLDFEVAKPGHALRDLARVMLGKYERDLENGRMVWINPGLPLSAIDAYHHRLALHGREMDSETWDRVFREALLHALVMQIGALVEHAESGDVTAISCQI